MLPIVRVQQVWEQSLRVYSLSRSETSQFSALLWLASLSAHRHVDAVHRATLARLQDDEFAGLLAFSDSPAKSILLLASVGGYVGDVTTVTARDLDTDGAMILRSYWHAHAAGNSCVFGKLF